MTGVRGLPGHIVALRPLTVGDTLDGIFQLLRASFGRLIAIVLLLTAPYQLLSSWLLAQVAPGFGQLGDPMAFEDPLAFELLTEELAAVAGWFGVTSVIGVVVSVVVAGALTAVAGAADRGEELTVGAALRVSIQRLGATLGASVLVLLFALAAALAAGLFGALLGFALTPLAFLLVVPVLLVIGLGGLVLGYLVIPIAIEEDRGAWTTFRRAASLVRRRFGYIVGLTMLVMLLLIAVTLGLGLIFLIATFLLGGLGWIAESVQAILTSLISAPVTALAAWVIHRDARVRLEAYDLVVRNQALRGGPVA